MLLTLAGFGAFLVAAIGCWVARWFALRHALVDVPNERSLHAVPVPRLGGVGIAVGCWASVALWTIVTGASTETIAWLVAAVVVALLGLLDDVWSLSAGTRFAVQIAVAVVFAVAIGFGERVSLVPGVSLQLPRALGIALAVVWIVGVLNIYNFMDGMDGLAGYQTVLAGAGLAVGHAIHGHAGVGAIFVSLAAAAAGFLLHNAPPAKIFMGDAGSTLIGFTFAALAIFGAGADEPTPFVATPIALAPFLLDGTFTIFRRLKNREKIWRAHRTHLYQRAFAAGLSHHDVLVPYVCWMAASAAASVWAASSGVASNIGAAALCAILLALVIAWVRRLEARPSK